MILTKPQIIVWVDAIIDIASSGRVEIAVLELKSLSEALKANLQIDEGKPLTPF